MKILGFLLRMFVISVMTAAILIGCAAIYLKFYGNAILEKQVSKMVGAETRFQSVAINTEKKAVNFSGFSIVDKIDFEKKIFNAEKVTVFLNKEKYDKEKKVVLDEVYIKKGVLNIERRANGTINLTSVGCRTEDTPGAVAYAAEVQTSGLYTMAQNFRKITIEDAAINFKDSFISKTPLRIYFDNFNFVFVSNQVPVAATGSILVRCQLNFRIPKCRYGDGAVAFSTDMAVYPDRVDMETKLGTKNVDLMLFVPYLSRNTPFKVSDGLISSATDFKIHNNAVDSLTSILFHKLKISLNPNMQNAQFLAASANELLKYLTSSSGEIVFDFVIKGTAAKPEFGLGPNVKFAVGMVVIEELSKALSQVQTK